MGVIYTGYLGLNDAGSRHLCILSFLGVRFFCAFLCHTAATSRFIMHDDLELVPYDSYLNVTSTCTNLLSVENVQMNSEEACKSSRSREWYV